MPVEFRKSFEESEKVVDIMKYKDAVWPERGIRPETFKRFGVKMAMASDGLSPKAIYFPYYSQEGKICGYKKRDLTKDKYEKGHFSVVGHVGVNCKLFGQQLLKKAKNIYVAEGEADLLAVYQALKDSLLEGPEKWKDLEPAVVSLSCGTANAAAAVACNSGAFDGYQNIILALDNDEASPLERQKGIMRGIEATEEVAGVLMRDNVYTLVYHDGFKDPNDYLIAGKGGLLAKALTFQTKKFEAEKVVPVSSFNFEEIIAEREKGIFVESFPKIMEMMYGLRKRELTVLTSLSGVGKSFVLTELGYNLAAGGARVGCIYLEEESRETVQRMMARRMGINYNKFKFNCKSLAPVEELQKAYNWVTGKDVEEERFYILEHFGNLRVRDLMSKIKYLTYVCKCDFILLDHLSAVIAGSDVKDERREFDLLMNELAAFVASNDVGILAVSHLSGRASDEIRGISDLQEPKWICVKKEDLRGSQALVQYAFTILGLEFEITPDRQRGRVRLTVLKNRPLGTLGTGDVFTVDNDTGYIMNADNWG